MTRSKEVIFADIFAALRGRIHSLLMALPEYKDPIVSVSFNSTTQEDWDKLTHPVQTSWVGSITDGTTTVVRVVAASPGPAMQEMIEALRLKLLGKIEEHNREVAFLQKVLKIHPF
jgi:hypothetical protein